MTACKTPSRKLGSGTACTAGMPISSAALFHGTKRQGCCICGSNPEEVGLVTACDLHSWECWSVAAWICNLWVPLHEEAKAKCTVACQCGWTTRKGASPYRFPGVNNPSSGVVWHPQQRNRQRFPPKLCQLFEIFFGFPKSMKNDRAHAIRKNTASLEQVFTRQGQCFACSFQVRQHGETPLLESGTCPPGEPRCALLSRL